MNLLEEQAGKSVAGASQGENRKRFGETGLRFLGDCLFFALAPPSPAGE